MTSRASAFRLTGRWLAPSVLALCAAACGHPVQRQLEGTWHGDSVENFDDRDLAPATGWAKSLRFTFSGEKLTVSIAAEEERTGKYRIRSVHNSDVVLSVSRADGSEDVTRLKLDDEREIRWMLGESRAVLLRREL
ncbi:MAG TPA: hypothetical protein VG937_25820 [Polyangiaceae bacterium]|jgi:hypothetical protein|nr:hypothetical protein [Polyangiaceae bacterium]